MPHQDRPLATAPAAHHQDLKAVLDWLTAGADFADARFRGTCTWSPPGPCRAALLWAWSDEATLIDRFAAARRAAALALGLDAATEATYQASLELLRARTATLVAALVVVLRRRMREGLAERSTVAGFAAFGVDGSRLQLPRTASNEGRFAATPGRRPRSKPKDRAAEAARRKKADSPQMWPTTAFHLGTGLPWDWRTGATGGSEREHPRQMFDGLPADALVVADAGFVGYETWEAVRSGGRHLLLRVGANVRLIEGLGYARERDGLVYLRPDREAARGDPPMVLRPVAARGPRHPVYPVTSVPEEVALPGRRVIELYRLRWGWGCSTAISSRRSDGGSCGAIGRSTPKWRRPGRSWACGRRGSTAGWSCPTTRSRHRGSARSGCCGPTARRRGSTAASPARVSRCGNGSTRRWSIPTGARARRAGITRGRSESTHRRPGDPPRDRA